MKKTRVVSWYSCGIASAVATDIAMKQYKDSHEFVIAYCDTGSEHELSLIHI